MISTRVSRKLTEAVSREITQENCVEQYDKENNKLYTSVLKKLAVITNKRMSGEKGVDHRWYLIENKSHTDAEVVQEFKHLVRKLKRIKD